jgi:hypothetical protein
MPRNGATLDENVPLGQGGLQGGDQPTSPNPSLCAFGKEGSHSHGSRASGQDRFQPEGTHFQDS